MKTLQFNLILAWVWIWFGFLSGLGLGLFFHREDWLGGYGSFKRRLYRLCHISFFGLGLINLCFYLTVHVSRLQSGVLTVASWALIVGALSMPLCCLLMAHRSHALSTFAVPVVSLLLGGTLTLVAVVRPNPQGRAVLPESPPSKHADYQNVRRMLSFPGVKPSEVYQAYRIDALPAWRC